MSVKISIRKAAPICVSSVYFSGGLCHVRFRNGGSHWYRREDIRVIAPDR